MLDDSHPSHSGIVALENELLVRDFIDLLNDGAVNEMRTFLHPDVTYRAASADVVVGCDAVLAIVRQFLDAFEHVHFRVQSVGLAERIVLVQHHLHVQLPGENVHRLDSFAKFELDGYRIIHWQQVHG